MPKRRRIIQTMSLHDRLATFAKEMRDKASLLPPSREKDDLLQRAILADKASHIDAGLQPPEQGRMS